ncbi:MAG: thermonuclease family protein [Flavobacteriaceae bacterium]|nr:thermonuclease family protein [Flavobacteriaceae bacterium]
MKKLFLALAFLMVLVCQGQSYTYTGKVVKIKDGDTITVLDTLNNQNTVRLAGVDAPEKKQEFGNVAKQFVSQEIFGKTVTVKIISVDIFKRPVGYVIYDDNINLSEVLLTRGLAWQFYDKSEYFKSLQDTAIHNRAGLWVLKDPVAPWLFRHPKKPSKKPSEAMAKA